MSDTAVYTFDSTRSHVDAETQEGDWFIVTIDDDIENFKDSNDQIPFWVCLHAYDDGTLASKRGIEILSELYQGDFEIIIKKKGD